MATEKIQATVTAQFINDSCKDLALTEKQELAVNGGGTSLFYKGSEFLVLVVHTKQHKWGNTEGKAFIVIDNEGNLDFCGSGRLKGGGGYVNAPKEQGTWKQTQDKAYWVCTTEEEGLEWKKFGVASAGLKNWVSKSAPIGCVHIQVDSVEYLYGCQPVPTSQKKPANNKAVFTKDVKAWTGTARFADAETIQRFVDLHKELLPDDVIPAEWLVCKG